MMDAVFVCDYLRLVEQGGCCIILVGEIGGKLRS
jgi:hypothetical protein